MVASITSTTVSAVSDVAGAASATVHVVADVAEKTSAAVSHAVADNALLDKDVHEKLYPDPNSFSAYQHSIYANFRPPVFTTDPGKWEELARKKIPHGNFWYAAGSAGLFRTAASNLDAFNRYRLRNRMFVDATVRDCSVELFGQKYESPLLVGPIGVQEIFHKDAEEAVARACCKTKVPMVLSMAASRTIEQVAAANGDGPRWFQVRVLLPSRRELC
jgi:lactate 2-monooxygenase